MKIIMIFFVYILFINNVECKRSYTSPFSDRIANYIIEYFQLDKLERLPVYNVQQNNSKYTSCASLENIEDYFFHVYATEGKYTMQDLDDLIHFHVKKTRKIENEKRHNQYQCQRRDVTKLKKISNYMRLILFPI